MNIAEALKLNAEWPPKSEEERLNDYSDRWNLLRGKHQNVFSLRAAPLRTQLKRELQFWTPYTTASVGDVYKSDRIHVPMTMPFIVGSIYSALLFGGGISPKPKLEAASERLGELMDRSDFEALCLEQAVLCSALGDCVWEVFRRDDKALIDLQLPQNFFPQFGRRGRNDIEQVLIAWKEQHGKDGKEEYLLCKWCTPGEVRYLAFELKQGKISSEARPDAFGLPQKPEQTPSEDLPFVHIPNFRLGSWFGVNDLGLGAETMLEELNNRVSQNSTILDKHADPPITGPEELMEFNPETGNEEVNLRAGYLPYRDPRMKAEYMVWNAQLQHSEAQIDRVVTWLALHTDLPPTVFLPIKTGHDDSAKKLRLELFRALKRVEKKRKYFDKGLRKLLEIAQRWDGEGKNAVEIEDIGWSDGLPDDYKELVEAETGRLAAKIQTRIASIMKLDRIDEEAAQQKLDEIEEAAEKEREQMKDMLFQPDHNDQGEEEDDNAMFGKEETEEE